MPHASGDLTEAPSDHATEPPRPHPVVDEAMRLLATPGLVVIVGGPGCGRSTVLHHLGSGFHGPVFHGGGLATLRSTPAFALTRALRVRLPTRDPALLAEAVRSRVRGGLLLLDDLHWADPVTLAALIPLAAHCRVAVALRTPHRLPTSAVEALRTAATGWLPVPALSPDAAADLARAVAPGLDPIQVADVVARAGGAPLAVTALARHSGTGPRTATRPADEQPDVDQLAYAVATALADLTRPARTALAALGLLGRPAPAAVLGAGIPELTAAALVTAAADSTIAPVSPYVAEVAAGLLDDTGRRLLHQRLADLVPPAEAPRHLAAAGDPAAAHQRAIAAAADAGSTGERADLLLFACALPDIDPPPQVRMAAAHAALACGRPHAAVQVLTVAAPDPALAVLRGEALTQLGDLTQARASVEPVPDTASADLVAARDRIRLLAALADDPSAVPATAAAITARHGPVPSHPGLRAALAAVAATTRAPGWEYALASAATAAASAGDPLATRWSAWLLVETLAADGRLVEAAQAARSAAEACAADLAYSWQTRFLATGLWCAALGGDTAAARDDTLRRAGDLADRVQPALARNYAVAAVSLIEADAGLLAPARARLAADLDGPGASTELLDWVDREAAWLDGQPEPASVPPTTAATPLLDGLRRITARWAAYDGVTANWADTDTLSALTPVRLTLAAWRTPTGGEPEGFDSAATAWHDLVVREEVRCLLAHGLHERDPARAVASLLAAEQLAQRAGLVVLLGRVQRALRRHAVRRDQRGPRTDGALTVRERDVFHLVAAGEPSRRIAGQLGISTETVETHIRAGMRKLGARTRTEAAALALATAGTGPGGGRTALRGQQRFDTVPARSGRSSEPRSREQRLAP